MITVEKTGFDGCIVLRSPQRTRWMLRTDEAQDLARKLAAVLREVEAEQWRKASEGSIVLIQNMEHKPGPA